MMLSLDLHIINAWILVIALVLADSQIALHELLLRGNQLGAVASENKICSQIGLDLLKEGGNAADTLVGTVFCVGVIAMYHSGIGGGGFMLVRSANGTYEAIDFRETAPAAAYENMFESNTKGWLFGGLSSGVPGEVRGLEYLHRKYGRLSWARVLEPAIKVARYGFPVSHDLVVYMESATKKYDFLTHNPSFATDFAPNGTRKGIGDTMTRRRYADVLENIAKNGADAFYTGNVAIATVNAVQAANGSMTLEDLQSYRIVLRNPVEMEYRGFRILSCGAPASGAVVLSALKTAEGYSGFGSPEMLNLSTHRLDEAVRFAYGERSSLGDPDFIKPVQSFEENMLSNEAVKNKRRKISDNYTLNVSDYNPHGFESPETHGTSHIVAADRSGLAISLTSTINLIFGSRVMVPETGIIMNNQMNDFSVPGKKNAFGYIPSPSNFIRPFKRPLSSMAPTIVEHLSNHSLYYALGAAGGSRIITAIIQNLWHVLDHNMTTQQSLAEPRLHDQLIPNRVGFEWGIGPEKNSGLGTRKAASGIGTGVLKGYDNATVEFMKGRGHNVTWGPAGGSIVQAIRWLVNGTWEAAGDPRQGESAGLVA